MKNTNKFSYHISHYIQSGIEKISGTAFGATFAKLFSFIRKNLKLIRWVAFTLAFSIKAYLTYYGGAIIAAYITGTANIVGAMLEGIRMGVKFDPIVFVFLLIFYATLTKYLGWLILIFVLYLLPFKEAASAYFILLATYELIERTVYRWVSYGVSYAEDEDTRDVMNFFKYALKFLGWIYIAYIVWSSLNIALDNHLKKCGWVPFKETFSALGYKSCGDKVNLTLRIYQSDETITFTIPSEYLKYFHSKDNEVKEIELLVAYPTFEPWHRANAEHPELIEPDPIEISISPRGKFKPKTLSKAGPSMDMEFIQDKYGLLEYQFKKVPPITISSSYYYPKDKWYPINYLRCASLIIPLPVACRAYADYSAYLYGEYTFRHKNIEHWQTIDLQVRKLIASLRQSPQVEKIYLTND
jgi:hypothetical protein